ncbi:hypothetical protein [Natrinema pallidum]|uniref:hypothetical protein n=1 Tax=Natrinema pallidum TaxID=69527 RepID=UPI003750F916
MSRAGWHYGSVDAVRSEAGVADQSDECRNGTEGCPGPDADVDDLPCLECLADASDGDREVATDGGRSTGDTDRPPEEIAEMVREFAADVSDPENWMISVPTESFDAVKDILDTDNAQFGTKYEGISFCYTQNHEQTQVRYQTDLENWNERALRTETDRSEGEEA